MLGTSIFLVHIALQFVVVRGNLPPSSWALVLLSAVLFLLMTVFVILLSVCPDQGLRAVCRPWS